MDLLNYTNALTQAIAGKLISLTEGQKLFKDFLNQEYGFKLSEDNTEKIIEVKDSKL